MKKIIIIGGGFAGCAAAIAARKAGARVVLLEKTDLLLGLGNVGGIMRNNGRYTATEENIAMGARELFDITDKYSLHRGVNFPGHRHASFFDIIRVEPAVRKLLDDMGIEVRMLTRAVDVEVEDIDTRLGSVGDCAKSNDGSGCAVMSKNVELANGDTSVHVYNENDLVKSSIDDITQVQQVRRIKAIKLADGEWVDGSAFVETTGSSGPMGGCAEHGRGCSMCVLRCPAFGPRVSISQRAGLPDLAGKRKGGQFGAFSGSGKLEMKSLAPAIQQELKSKGVAVVPLPPEKIVREKLEQKVCQQYALNEYAENIILIDTGHAKIMTPYFPLEALRTIPGFEQARYADPYAGGKGNSIRYLSVAERDNTMRVKGFENLFCGGEKAGLFVGHTEAISTGSLAGHNAARLLATESNPGDSAAVHITAGGAPDSQPARREAGPFSFAGPAGRNSAQGKAPAPAGSGMAAHLLQLPRSTAVGDLIAYGNEKIQTEAGLRNRYTFAGDEFFERMQERGLYTTDANLIRRRIDDAGMMNIYNQKVN